MIEIATNDERVLEIGRHLTNTDRKEQFNFDKKNYDCKIITIGLKFLLYRLNNTRTISAQHEYIENQGLDSNFFNDGRLENTEVQNVQHELLLREVDAVLDKAYEHHGGQTDALIIYPNGLVINGNRRLCYMRQNQYRESKCLVIEDVNLLQKEKEIEAYLDYVIPAKRDFVWTSIGLEIIRLLETKTPNEIAQLRSLPNDTDVKIRAEATNLAKEKLQLSGTSNRWSLVEKSEQIYMDAASKIVVQNLDPLKKEALRASVQLIDSASSEAMSGRKYRHVQDAIKFIDHTVLFMPEIFGEEEISAGNEFGGGGEISKTFNKDNFKSSFADQDSVDDVVENLLGKIEIVKDTLADQGSRNALKKHVNKAASEIEAAATILDRDDLETAGVEAKVSLIKGNLEKIEDYLA